MKVIQNWRWITFHAKYTGRKASESVNAMRLCLQAAQSTTHRRSYIRTKLARQCHIASRVTSRGPILWLNRMLTTTDSVHLYPYHDNVRPFRELITGRDTLIVKPFLRRKKLWSWLFLTRTSCRQITQIDKTLTTYVTFYRSGLLRRAKIEFNWFVLFQVYFHAY